MTRKGPWCHIVHRLYNVITTTVSTDVPTEARTLRGFLPCWARVAHRFYTSTLRLENTGWAAFTQTSIDSVPNGQNLSGRDASKRVKNQYLESPRARALSLTWGIHCKFSGQPLEYTKGPRQLWLFGKWQSFREVVFMASTDKPSSHWSPSYEALSRTKLCSFFPTKLHEKLFWSLTVPVWCCSAAVCRTEITVFCNVFRWPKCAPLTVSQFPKSKLVT